MDPDSVITMLQGRDPVEVILFLVAWFYLKSIANGVAAEAESEQHKKTSSKREAALDVLAAAIEEAQAAQAKTMVENMVQGTELEEVIEEVKLRAENGTGKYKK